MLDSGHNQHVSSIIDTCDSSKTPMAKELVSTYTSLLSTQHLSLHGSRCFNLVIISVSILFSGALSVRSSQTFITALALHLMTPAATHSHPQTGRCPTRLPEKKNTFILVTTSGTAGSAFPCFQSKTLS